MTEKQSERTLISAIRMIFANATGMILVLITPVLVKQMGDDRIAYIYAALTILFLIVTFLGTRERIQILQEASSSKNPIEGFCQHAVSK